MNITVGDYEYKEGNISSTQTIDKMFMSIDKARVHASKLDGCVGFSVQGGKRPSIGAREYMCHFKTEPATVMDSNQWHTFLVPKNVGGSALTQNDTTTTTSLQVPGGGGAGKKSKHSRTVTNFCREANIGEDDQLDLAEFIVAARYLGTDANDDQLMDVFMEMEDTANTKDPKQLIKELMKRVEDEYNVGDIGDAKDGGGGLGDDDPDDDANEILQTNPLDAFAAEDAIWQEDQIDSFLNQSHAEQNLKIARNLLATTALTRHEIAEITGVAADLLKDYESDYSSDEDDDEEDDDDEESTALAEAADAADAEDDGKEQPALPATPLSSSAAAAAKTEGVVIQSSDFSKSVTLTRQDLGLLKALLDGGAETVAAQKEDALKLLSKLHQAINLNPKGHSKNKRTLARLKVEKLERGKSGSRSDEEQGAAKEVKLPAKYRVVIHPGALCKETKELSSKEVCKLPIGTVVTVVEIEGRRARVSAPSKGWLSLHASDGRVILQKSNVKSAAMDKAIHAERARQTKVLILKSITTLNDATVTRILEKSDWNLRRAIEAFYIAKYKTQEYLTKKEQSGKGTANSHSGGGGAAKSAPTSPGHAPKTAKGGGAKKGKTAWWKSWKSFAHDNP